MNDKLRERLAEYAHNTWAGWMEYMFSECEHREGGIFMPAWAYERWTRQKDTAYADLPESEKRSDREEADRILALAYPPEVQTVLKIVMVYITGGGYENLYRAIHALNKMEKKK